MNIDAFPVLNNYTYLNTANSGILSRDIADWRRDHDDRFLEGGSQFRLKRDEFFLAGRNALAAIFYADPSHTFLVPNFSHGFNTVLNGLEGRKSFVLLKDDYPSINYAVAARGHLCIYTDPDELIEENLLRTVQHYRPEVLALSLVQYHTGIMVDLHFIRQLKKDFPELLIIADGTQLCGTGPFDFKNSGIDVLISSGYKWMLGGYGNAFVLLSAYAAELLYKGYKSFALPPESFLKGRGTLSLIFEPGHLDTLSFGTLFKSLELLKGMGMEAVSERITDLGAKARLAFEERGLLSQAVVNRKVHSSIFNLNLEAGILEKLEDNGIIVTSRGSGVRVSFHFYNTREDLAKLLRVIDRTT